MIHSVPLPSSEILRRLVVAAWGTCCGLLAATVLTAALIAIRGDTHDQPHPALLASEYLKDYEIVPWQERYERTWYALACAGGALCGWAAIRFAKVSAWIALPAACGFVPAVGWSCRGVFSGEFPIGRFLVCLVILLLPLIAPRRRERGVSEPEPALAPIVSARARTIWLSALILCLPLGVLLYGVLGPHHIRTVASECNTELHVASYIVGPALYYRAPGVVPALDFESHYGIGHAYTFSLVMGSGGLSKTLERYVLFVLVISILYFLSALLVLTDWFQSAWAACLVTLLVVFTSCEGLAYNTPSCWPVRYPFLFAFLFAAVRAVRPNGRSWCAVAGGVAGLSLFWQTDIGLYTFAAGLALLLGYRLFLGGTNWRPAVFLAAGGGSFFALCLVCFGPRVCSPTFVERLLEPLLLYANGFGNQVMNWKPGWGYWYNLIGPGLAIASVAVVIGYGRRGSTPPRAMLYGAAASLLGLAMLFKWVNRSIDILWSLNGGLVVAVAGWWAWVAWRSLADRLACESPPRLGLIRQMAAAVVLVLLIVQAVRIDGRSATSKYQGGSSSPLVRATIWLGEFRNPINAARRGFGPGVRPSPIDVASTRYLRDHTDRNERVAIVCGADWNYLAAAGRAPRLYWLQLFLVHSPVLLDRCATDLRNSDRVFVDRHALTALHAVNPTAHDVILPILLHQFEIADRSSPRWDLYRRKPGPIAGR